MPFFNTLRTPTKKAESNPRRLHAEGSTQSERQSTPKRKDITPIEPEKEAKQQRPSVSTDSALLVIFGDIIRSTKMKEEELLTRLNDMLAKLLDEKLDSKLAALKEGDEKSNKAIGDKVERYKREKNIVISNIPEDEGEEVDDLLMKANDIFEKMGIHGVEVDDIYRIGRKKANGKPRPLLVKLLRNYQKRSVMKEKKQLKGEKIYINDDLTFDERKVEKALRDKYRDLSKGSKDYRMGIRNGKMTIWKSGAKFKEYIVEGDVVMEAPERMIVAAGSSSQ